MVNDILQRLDGDEELKEPEICTEEQHIAEFYKLKELNKSEKECSDMN